MKSNSIEREGVHHCGKVIEKMGLIFREQLNSDYGIDAIIETHNKDYVSGKLIAVQIKSGESYFREEKNNNIIFRGDIKHYDYWLKHSLPVIIVLYDLKTEKCIWEHVNKQTAHKLDLGWKIEIPCDKILVNSKRLLEIITNSQSEYERRLHSLVLAKNWMLKIEKEAELILEVQEWINKSSGRGNFKLISIDNNGNVSTLFQREFIGFGNTEYETVIQKLFPWAHIEIDEKFYDENMEDSCYQRKNVTDRDLAIRYGKSGSELLRYNDTPRRLYPYRNGVAKLISIG